MNGEHTTTKRNYAMKFIITIADSKLLFHDFTLTLDVSCLVMFQKNKIWL